MAKTGKAAGPMGVAADWENELAAWGAGVTNETAITTTWKPTNSHSFDSYVSATSGIFGETCATPGNKTLHFYRRTLWGQSSYDGDTVYGRLYNNTQAVAIASVSLSSDAGVVVYSSVHGNPLLNYDYTANDVIFCQIMQGGSNNKFKIAGVLFEARVVDR